MAYEVVMPYHLHMPSYFLETFTEYPEYPCLHRININRFFTIFQMKDYMISYLSEL